MNYAEIGRKNKENIQRWKLESVQAQLARPELIEYIHDHIGCTTLQELDDETLGRVCAAATAENLRALGYKGARTNNGDTVVTLNTAILNKTVDRFGRDAVYRGYGEEYRGFRNTTAIRNFYNEEMDRLIMQLLRLPQK